MEFIIVLVIVVLAGYIFYSSIKKQASGDCGCGNGCEGCGHSCQAKKPVIEPVKDDSKIQ